MVFRILSTCALLCLASALFGQRYALQNGNFFNGETFEEGTWYTQNGVLTSKAPDQIDSVIDLSGKYIIPAMGDAFCQSVADNSLAPNLINMYWDGGIFYLMIAGNTQEGRADAENLLSGDNKPDATYTNGSATRRGGYPILKYEAMAAEVRIPSKIAEQKDELLASRAMQGNGYWTFNTKEEVKEYWKKFQKQDPGVLLIQLRHTGTDSSQGLDPDIAKLLVRKCHKLFGPKMTVFAQIETIEDFRLAQDLKVDGIVGLPGNGWNGSGSPEAFKLSDADIKKLAARKTALIPLLSQAQRVPGVNLANVKKHQAETLQRLFEAGANVCIGSGDPQRTIRNELNYWFQLGNLDNAAALKVLCQNTPAAVFANRKVGRIAKGYEANLIVLGDNPLSNMLKVRAIEFKMKAGKIW